MSQAALDDLLELYRWRTGVEDPLVLDWTGTMRVQTRITDAPFRDARPCAPARNTVIYGPAAERLDHADDGVEVVVVQPEATAERLVEARRIARDLVIAWAPDGTVSADWLHDARPGRVEVTICVETQAPADAHDELRERVARTVPALPAIEVLVAADLHDGGGRAAARNEVLRLARGDLLVVLGDHVTPQAGWLRPLVRPLLDHPDVGAVGGLLATAQGDVVSAGGTLFADGSHGGFGAGTLRLGDPRVEHVRDVRYAGGGLLATRTGLVRRLGGWDTGIESQDLDVDLGLRLRLDGRRSVHQPQSLGLADTAGDRPLPPAHDALFPRRWYTVLRDLPARPAVLDASAWDQVLARTP